MGRATAAGAFLSILVGVFVVGLLYFIQTYPLDQWLGVWGTLASSSVYLIVSLLTKPRKPQGS